MTTRRRIRNQAAFDKAEEKRMRRQQRVVEEIAARLSPILRDKHNGELVAPCIEIVWIQFAQGGGISPLERRCARQQGISAQVLMRDALELVIERGEISMTVLDSGEVVLSNWPPVNHAVLVDPIELQEHFQDMADRHVPEHLLRRWAVV